MATIAQTLRKLRNLRRSLNNSNDRVEKVVLSTQLAFTSTRVFVNGKASDGKLITSKVAKKETGAYGKQQGKKRKKAGRQVNKVDLNFGSTTQKDLIVGKQGRKNVLGFATDRSRNIAAGHEAYREKPIFKPTRQEKKKLGKVAVAEYRKIIRSGLR